MDLGDFIVQNEGHLVVRSDVRKVDPNLIRNLAAEGQGAICRTGSRPHDPPYRERLGENESEHRAVRRHHPGLGHIPAWEWTVHESFVDERSVPELREVRHRDPDLGARPGVPHANEEMVIVHLKRSTRIPSLEGKEENQSRESEHDRSGDENDECLLRGRKSRPSGLSRANHFLWTPLDCCFAPNHPARKMRPKSKREICFPRPTSYEDSSCPGAFCSRGSHTEMQSAGGSHDSCGSPSWPRMVRLRIWGAGGEPHDGIEPPTCALRERKHAGRLSAAVGLSAEDRPSRTPRWCGHGPDGSRCSGQGDDRPSTCATRTRRDRRAGPPLAGRESAGSRPAGGLPRDSPARGAPPRSTSRGRGSRFPM